MSAERLFLYVAYHDADVLRGTQLPPHARRLLLGDLDIPAYFRDNRFAENRALLHFALNPALLPEGYVGLFHASWNTKFAEFPPLVDLPGFLAPLLEPSTLLAPILSGDYLQQADNCHPGIGSAILRVLLRAGIEHPRSPGRRGPMCNTFVAHSAVWRAFLPVWLRGFLAAQDECLAAKWDQRNCKPGVLPAYLLERITTAYFVGAEHVKPLRLTTPSNTFYYCKGEE